MRKIIILKHGGGELANQLWNYLSVYAFGLERGISVLNPSFFEYHCFFRFLKEESWVTRLTSRLFFRAPRRRSSWINRNQRLKYALRAWIVGALNASCVYSSENSENRQTYLPPTAPLPDRFDACSKLYLTGWLFRNPAGLAKFGKELRAAFAPSDEILRRVDAIISPLRSQYQHVIGVHIRQSDYAGFKGGRFVVSQVRFREVMGEFLRERRLDPARTVFVIASDGRVDERVFAGLNVAVSRENSVVDLFLLSRADAVIGSDSSFGAFAAWHGDIPHIIARNDAMDWAYYANKNSFFENRLSELMKY
ncbi:MAG TPA: hypothetical protein VFQ72_02675 [Candidatus Paceibacterota bacterium]|nr:hypothetical protein [Candidatus Paceibacterota bacterium]